MSSRSLFASTHSLVFSLLFFIALCSPSYAQTSTIVSGSTTNRGIPIEPFYGYTYSEQIYLQSEIAQAGDITEIYFQYNGNSAWTDNIVVYMGHTTKSSFTGSTDWITSSSMTQVYNGTISVTTTAGWVKIILDAPFTYNNSDNLVIAVDENTAGYHSSGDEFLCAARTNRSIYYRNDSNNPNPASPPTATSRQSYVPNLQLTIIDPNDQTSTISAGALGEPTSINSIANDSEPEILTVFDFAFQDPGSGDGLNTIIDQLVMTQGSANAIADWTDVIAGARLSGPDLGVDLAGTVNPTNITFASNDMISIADGGSAETYSLKIWLNTTLTGNTIDNDLLEFRIENTGITTDASGSSFAADSEESGNTGLAIDIDATQLAWETTIPVSQLINADFAAQVKATDANGNIDVDATGTVTLTEAGAGNLASVLDPDLMNSFTNGIVSWTDLQYDNEETAVVFTATHSGAYGSINNTPGTNFISGTIITVCPSGCDYTNIQAAYQSIEAAAPISTSYIIELQQTYTDANEPAAGIDFDDVAGASVSNTVTIRPAADVTSALEIAFDPTGTFTFSISTAYLLEFDDADFITIDGRPGGIGTDRFITFENTADPNAGDAGAVIVFTNSANNNVIQYCNVYGETEYNGSTELGLIHYHMDGTDGNDNNDIDNCVIGDRPSGTSFEPSSGITFRSEPVSADNVDITNNQFRNIIGNDVGVTKGEDFGYIFIEGEVSNLTITGNSFYSTIDLDDDSGSEKGFIVSETTRGLNNITISNNFFGSKAANAAGSELVVSGENGAFYGIKIGAATQTGNIVISNNVISAIEKRNSADFFPIYLQTRSTTSSIISGNTISAIDRFGLGDFTAIHYGAGAGGATVSITNNTIENFDLLGEFSGSSNPGNFGDPTYRLIGTDNADESDVLIDNNTFEDLYFDTDIISGTLFFLDNQNELDFTNNVIGNASVSRDIEIHVDAIFNLLEMESDGTGAFTVNDNTFQNVWWSIDNFNDGIANNYNGGAAIFNGAVAGGIILSANDNTIRDFEYGVGSSDYPGHLKGIEIENTASSGTINYNRFFNWHNATTYTAGVDNRMVAIHVYSGFNITKNIMGNFTNDQPKNVTGRGTFFHGISVDNGANGAVITNNVILFDNSGDAGLIGIEDEGDNTQIYHNTIQLTGTVSSGVVDCYGYNRTSSAGGTATIFKNNSIQVTSSGGSGVHNCMEVSNSSPTFTCDYNAYDFTGANVGRYSSTRTFANWQAAGLDANGINESVTLDSEGYAINAGWSGIDGGENILATVADDRNSGARDVAPWIGAYEGGAALPVELVAFNATLANGAVLLDWSTATEINNSHFEVQRSNDGIHFETVVSVLGQGNSTQLVRYQAFDNTPLTGVSYYRLKQVDFDGAFEYSPMRAVEVKQTVAAELSLYPVPANEVMNVSFTASEEGEVQLQCYATTGRLVLSEMRIVEEGRNVLPLQVSKLMGGVYVLEIMTQHGTERTTFVKR